MTRRSLHIVLLWLLALFACGCVDEFALQQGEADLTLTVRCDEPLMTRAEDSVSKDGVATLNENLILSVDFLFYPGNSFSGDSPAPAVYRIRKERTSEEAKSTNQWDITLRLKENLIKTIFPDNSGGRATVYALVNFKASDIGDLSETSRPTLAQKRIFTDFVQEESNYTQPSFLMDGSASITYDTTREIKVQAEDDIKVRRFAAKLTMGIHLADTVVLRHQAQQDSSKTLPPETWTPVPHTMRLYLVDGVKSVLLSDDGLDTVTTNGLDTLKYFSYKDDAHKRPFLNDNNIPYFATETLNDKEYYHTWPMYTYPRIWDNSVAPNYYMIDYTRSRTPTEPPYFKLEMDWRRMEDKNYSYDRRKYYYKVIIPFDLEKQKFERNNWYGFYLDVGILGSETDEGKAVIEPFCFLLDWQNKSLAINKAAVISKARYLSLEKSKWEINNLNTLTIPFLSSHDVVVVGKYDPERKPKATRPYYGEITTAHPVDSYHEGFHAWIRDDGKGGYLLDYSNQPAGEKYQEYEPANWLPNTSTSIILNHPLENRYNVDGVNDFDYSPYTIEFDIVHDDLERYPSSITYQQYIRHITITQYPGIYIECLHNRDQEIEKIGTNGGGYPNHPVDKPWPDYPWGYVYVNGGRFIRRDPGNNDPYFSLKKDKDQKEYQWQTVYYTGGSKDIFDIHVTVLPSSSNFVIGDPRVDAKEEDAEGTNYLNDEVRYPNLYKITVEDGDDLNILKKYFQYQQSGTPYDNNGTRTGFNVAAALYGDSPRSLKWYYPTDKSTRTANMLAPSYRISTKLGGTEFGSLSKEYAEYRCAGYQEDGLPAGRWRLPTKAEIHFIAQLSAKKFFKYIFTTGSGSATYWSANGAITVNADNGTVTDSTSPTALLRCVYDSWYWDEVDRQEGLKETGDDPRFDNPTTKVPTTFYWGDKQR